MDPPPSPPVLGMRHGERIQRWHRSMLRTPLPLRRVLLAAAVLGATVTGVAGGTCCSTVLVAGHVGAGGFGGYFQATVQTGTFDSDMPTYMNDDGNYLYYLNATGDWRISGTLGEQVAGSARPDRFAVTPRA